MAKQLTAKQTVLASYGGMPTASNVVTLADFTFVNPKVDTIDYKDVGLGKLGSSKTVVNTDLTTVEMGVTVNVRGNGGGANVPKISEMLKICGLEQIVDTDHNLVKYIPAQSIPANGTIAYYLDGTKRVINGVVGNGKISFNVGEIVKAEFDLKGFTDAEPILEANPTITLDDNALFIVQSIHAVTIGGDAINLKSGTLDFGIDTTQIYAVGMKEFLITDYLPSFTINEIKEKGNESHWTAIANGEVKELLIEVLNANGDKLTLKASGAKLKEVGESDTDGFVGVSRTYQLEQVGNEPNFELVFS